MVVAHNVHSIYSYRFSIETASLSKQRSSCLCLIISRQRGHRYQIELIMSVNTIIDIKNFESKMDAFEH